MVVLVVEQLTKRFGGLIAVKDISFQTKRGEILSIIGPNGAGKSTLFKLVCSFLKPTSGRVLLDDMVISGRQPHHVAQAGVVRTFQETTVFKEMTALQNVIVAHQLKLKATPFGAFFSSSHARTDAKEIEKNSHEILDYLGLGSVKNEFARNLPHGSLRALGIAIALAARPNVLLLDEPFAGMNMEETDKAVKMVEGIRQRGVTILLVEHDMRAVMRISDRIIVVNFGSQIAEGTPEEIKHHPAVIEAYLGQDDERITGDAS